MRDKIKLLLTTNRKSHMGFRLVRKSVTLNGVTAVILLYCTEFASFVKVVKDGPILSAIKI